ncbi:MAG: MFS transporter [Candidatus Dormibacteraceae bacterium]
MSEATPGPELEAAQPTSLLAPGVLRQATIGIVLLTTLFAFENMAVSTAMPTAVSDLHGLAWYGWGFTAFLIVQLVGNVLGGVLSDRRGAALPVIAGVLVFIAGLLVAGSATTMGQFVLGRGVQGLGAGLVMVAIYVVIGAVYPESLRASAVAILSAAWVVPTLIGPGVSGLLTQYLSWRAVFFVIVPLAVIGLLLVAPSLKGLARPRPRVEEDSRPDSRPDRWRWPSAVALASGIALLQYAGERLTWLSLLPLASGVVLVGLGLPHLMPRGTFRLGRGLPSLMLLRAIMSGTFFGVESAVTLTLTRLHGFEPATVGLPLIVGSLGWSAAAWIVGRQSEARRELGMRAGFGMLVVACVGMAALGWSGTPGWIAFPTWIVGGAGIGMAMPAVSVLVLNLSPVEKRGANTSSLQLADGTGSSICIALQGTLVAAATVGTLSLGQSVTTLDLILGVVALGGVLLTSRLHPA